jgi:mannose/fructose-specific phosphotransferase system component IIA
LSEEDGVRGVLLAHGSLAQGLADAVRQISGMGEEVLLPISNSGKTPQVLEEELRGILGDDPAVVFTDLGSGSCTLAARRCMREDCSQVVVTGVNLPILLEFVFNRHLPLGELVPRLLEKGTEAVQAPPGYRKDVDPSLSR